VRITIGIVPNLGSEVVMCEHFTCEQAYIVLHSSW
jgi:hypothetical protein